LVIEIEPVQQHCRCRTIGFVKIMQPSAGPEPRCRPQLGVSESFALLKYLANDKVSPHMSSPSHRGEQKARRRSSAVSKLRPDRMPPPGPVQQAVPPPHDDGRDGRLEVDRRRTPRTRPETPPGTAPRLARSPVFRPTGCLPSPREPGNSHP